ncbi:MAG: DNA-processing protein DprA [Deltaproteobacteria bacterium]|nr:DNA-processing protein DprA [Deltaproteobacteria bacterium]
MKRDPNEVDDEGRNFGHCSGATGGIGGRYRRVMLGDRSGRARLVTSACADYPAGLRDLSDAPDEFRTVGELPDLHRAVAIVGTRRADDEALDFAYTLARAAVLNGFVVVSGGAIGVDRAAHEGAIDGGGRTVVVLPTGLDTPYPRANYDLFARVPDAGCLLTEADDCTDARPGRFLKRNRLIAALGGSTVVVQAPARSGALSTARFAKQLGRPVFAVPASPWDPRGSGNLGLLRKGARICVGPTDVLSETALRGPGRVANSPPKSENTHNFSDLTQAEQTILESLGGRARHAEDLCQRTGMPAFEVQQSILRLLVRGLVEEKPGGRYQTCRSGRKPY